MKTTFLVAAIAAGITLAASAQAREGHGPRMEMPAFEDLDLNSDGEVTAAEIQGAMQARAAARFAETDTNGDGALSAEEMVARAEGAQQERMASRIAERIENADTNGDGLLQADEMAAQAEDRRGERGPERMFNRFDADENGSLSAQEFAEVQTRMENRGERGDRRHGGRHGDN